MNIKKQDRHGVRTASDLERKYNFTRMEQAAGIAEEAAGIAEEANKAAKNAAEVAASTAQMVVSPEFKSDMAEYVISVLPRYNGEVELL
jgi:hypothetical protein